MSAKWWRSSPTAYELLSTSERDAEEDTPQNHDHTTSIGYNSRGDRLVVWACTATLLSSLLTFSMAVLNMRKDNCDSGEQFSGQNPPNRHPNQYINFDSVFRDRPVKEISHERTIVNFPDVVALVYETDATRHVYEDTSRQWRATLGTVFPDDRHIIVSAAVSTVVQFFHLDYGMENCSLMLSVPPPSHGFDPEVIIQEGSSIDVWLLESTWSERLVRVAAGEVAPQRKTLVATIQTEGNQTVATVENFLCPSGDLTLFEIACAKSSNGPCHLEFWQNGEISPPAVQECSLCD
ncbi:hypothetical protein EDD85DRAFT_78212 [Armillaria nabsnona]|nr:hypothetical protein EDD85DRAFT_78212 [Armillaria nabsnona]